MFLAMIFCALVCGLSAFLFSMNLKKEYKKKAVGFCSIFGLIYGALVIPEITFLSYSFLFLTLTPSILLNINSDLVRQSQKNIFVLLVMLLVVIVYSDKLLNSKMRRLYVSDAFSSVELVNSSESIAEDSVESFLDNTGLYYKYRIVGETKLQKLNTMFSYIDENRLIQNKTFNGEYYWIVLLKRKEDSWLFGSQNTKFAYVLVSDIDKKELLFVQGLYNSKTEESREFVSPTSLFFNSYRLFRYLKSDLRYSNYSMDYKALKIDREGNPFFVFTKTKNIFSSLSIITLNLQNGISHEYSRYDAPIWINLRKDIFKHDEF